MTSTAGLRGPWRTPALLAAAVGSVAFAGIGLILSRPDLVATAAPLAFWAILVFDAARRERQGAGTVELLPLADGEDGALRGVIVRSAPSEMSELFIEQSERRHVRVFTPGTARLTAFSKPLHSGPIDFLRVRARSVAGDGALTAGVEVQATDRRAVAPASRPVGELPLAPRLTGLHGAHEGSRPGQGGDFRDIHPFAPGDELRRVDWRATARAARRQGELFVRRTNTLSDASVVIAVDAADELGEVASTWGSGDQTRSGTTSLDHAREAARALATAAIGAGDRVAYHVLAKGGRSLRGGTGSRHLARLITEIAATGPSGDDSKYRRTPPVPHGSVIAVVSTFFDGAAADLAVTWRAVGHRVIAVDTLPDLDTARLTPQQALALRILLAERDEVFHDLTATGVDVVRWDDDAAIALAAAARIRVGGRR